MSNYDILILLWSNITEIGNTLKKFSWRSKYVYILIAFYVCIYPTPLTLVIQSQFFKTVYCLFKFSFSFSSGYLIKSKETSLSYYLPIHVFSKDIGSPGIWTRVVVNYNTKCIYLYSMQYKFNFKRCLTIWIQNFHSLRPVTISILMSPNVYP